MEPDVVGDDDSVAAMVLQEQVWVAVVGECPSSLSVLLVRSSLSLVFLPRQFFAIRVVRLGQGILFHVAAGTQRYMNLSASIAPVSARPAPGQACSTSVPPGMEREDAQATRRDGNQITGARAASK